jgi:selenocysteine lyase/cysteine desulfurase
LEAILAAADAHDVMTVMDATQAVGWLPVDASRFDVVACGAYKWLMSPRGTAFMYVRRERLAEIEPITAGWYGGEDVHGSYFGPPLRLAERLADAGVIAATRGGRLRTAWHVYNTDDDVERVLDALR